MFYPPAARSDLHVSAHGRHLPDPYRWLEDRHCEQSRAWLAGQQQLFDEHALTWSARAAFRERLTAQFATGMVGLPTYAGGRAFFVLRGPDEQHLSQCVLEADGTVRKLVDPMQLDPAGLTTADQLVPSPDGTRAVTLISRGGDEISLLSVLDVDTGEVLEGPLDRCHALYTPVEWLPDGSGFYYVRCQLPSYNDPTAVDGSLWQLRLHRLGTSFDADALIHLPADLARSDALDPSLSKDGRWLLVKVTDMLPGVPGDLYVADLNADATMRPLLVGRTGEVWPVWGAGNRLYVRTSDGAPRWRIATIEVGSDDEAARPLIAQPDEPLVIKAHAIVGDQLVVRLAEADETSRLVLHDTETGEVTGQVPLPGVGAVGGPIVSRERPDRLFFVYGDHRTPQSAWTWRVGDDAATQWMRRPGELDTSGITIRRFDVSSHDGELVPVVLMHVGELHEPRAAVVMAYGGFGYSVLTPNFDHWGAAWTAMGGLYVVVGARGGGEKGEQWHRDGMRENKGNTFLDVVSVARWLSAQGWTTPAQTGVSGLSNGALTAAACIQKWPAEFGAAVACAMHADNLKALRDSEPVWSEEYGDGRVPEEFDWLLEHSPYHNAVQGTCYPALLVCAFGKDTRTLPEEGHKFTALMQWARGCDRPVLLRHEEEAGHATRSVDSMVSLLTDWLSFLAEHLGLQVSTPALANLAAGGARA